MQISVAVFPSLGGEALEDVTLRVVEAWKPGQKGQDNGVLLALFMAEKKLRIEVGYGLEGRINDAAAGRIIRNVIAPEFRNGDFGGGLLAGVDAIAARATGGEVRERPDRLAHGQRVVRIGAQVVPIVLIGLLMLFVAFARLIGRGHELGARGSSVPWLIALLLSGRGRGPRGGGWGGGSWGGGGGGDWGGGGGSFGGGSFGGGGASGGW